MKTKKLSLWCFLLLSLYLTLSLEPTLANTSEQKEDLTLVISAYLDDLRVNCNFQIEEFTKIQEALEDNSSHLTNPISKEKSLELTTCYPYWANFNQIIEVATPERVDYQKILSTTKQIISQIKKNEEQRDEVRKKTENINLEMDFVDIPKGKYEDEFIGTFEIADDVAIQTTPVTQYQWAKVMVTAPPPSWHSFFTNTRLSSSNPAHFKTGEDSRKVEIDGKQIEMCPNMPVENISYEDIKRFITALNERDLPDRYELPSVQEYLAIMGDNTQIKGSACLKKNKTCSVEMSSYRDLDGKNIYAISDNVLQFTRDKLTRADFPRENRILFGFPYYSNNNTLNGLTSITKPLHYEDTASYDIGFRLVRYKNKINTTYPKTNNLEFLFGGEKTLYLKTNTYDLAWDEKALDISPNKYYIWDPIFQIHIHKAEFLTWLRNNQTKYPEQTQDTIKALLQMGSIKDLIERESLDLSKKNISDLTPLPGLVRLKKLYLFQNEISDLTPLKKMMGLESLSLDQNKISDITPLSNLTNLKTLSLKNNNISNIAPLKSLKKLKRLHLEQNNIADLTAIKGLTNLDWLSLGQNKISDTAPLAYLRKLVILDLSDNNSPNITPLAELTELKGLNLSKNNISNINSLSGLTRLQWIYLDQNEISDLTPLSGLTGLGSLRLSQNQISDPAPLANFTNLDTLYISDNKVTTISPLAKLPALTYLDIRNNPVGDYDSLKQGEIQSRLTIDK